MSSNKTVKIYCEGKLGSHDFFVLNKIVANLTVEIQPIGGTRGAELAIQAHELVSKSDVFLFFRDRDFETFNPSMSSDGYTYYSHRTTIENYLFDHNRFFEFIEAKKLTRRYKIKSPADAEALFIKAAKQIAYYQALRHTIARLRNPNELGTTWLSQGSGNLPTLLELNNKPFCRQKALAHLAVAKQETDTWTEQTYDDTLNTFYDQFEKPDFYTNAEFLIWFQGKDFAKMLSLLLPSFPMNGYFRFAKKYFDYTQFDDLVQFRREIELINLSSKPFQKTVPYLFDYDKPKRH